MDRKSVYALIVVFVTMVGVGLANVAYTDHVEDRRVAGEKAAKKAAAAAREAGTAQLCRLLAAIDDSYKESPPQTPAGQRAAEVWAQYRIQLHCP